MKPVLLHGGERAITCITYNMDGDLVFTASKDNVAMLWRADTGIRIGTYNGHVGTVWDLSVSWDSKLLLSASGDATVIIWNVKTGEKLLEYSHHGPVKSVAWAEGAERFASVHDSFKDSLGNICVFETPRNVPPEQWDMKPIMVSPIASRETATRVTWGPFNEYLIVAYGNGSLVQMDPVSGAVLLEKQIHTGPIQRMVLNKERTLILTCSKDYTAKLLVCSTFEVLFTYVTDRPVNAAVIHPKHEHIILGGGQEAMQVTTTGARSGRFESRFYHMVYCEEFGRVKGHFGPVNALAIAPDGSNFCSGAEDGYVRLHHFDQDYVDWRDNVPDELELQDGDEEEQDKQLE